MKIFIALLFAMHSVLVSSQVQIDSTQISSTIFKLCEKLNKDSIIESEQIYYGGYKSKQWMKYQQIYDLASDSVLFQLTNHESPTVRGYAFYGLTRKKSLLLVNALQKNENDSTLVETQQGCMQSTYPVYELAVQDAYYMFQADDFEGLPKEDIEYIVLAHRNIMNDKRENRR